jgi:hypothetical protein
MVIGVADTTVRRKAISNFGGERLKETGAEMKGVLEP